MTWIVFFCICRRSLRNLYWSQNLVWEVWVGTYCTRQRTPLRNLYSEITKMCDVFKFYDKKCNSIFNIIRIINQHKSITEMRCDVETIYNQVIKITQWWCDLRDSKYSAQNMLRIRFYVFTFHMDSLTFAVKYELCPHFTLRCWCWCWHSKNCLLCLVWFSVTTNTEHWLWQHIIRFEKKLSPSIKIRLPASSLGFQNLQPSHCWNDFWI